MADGGTMAGRSYGRVYRVHGRSDQRDYLLDAVRRAGGEVLYASGAERAPVFLGVQGRGDERLGVLCYPFRCNEPPIGGRDPDEHRLQVRYGGEESWETEDHRLGFDLAGVDTTVVLGVHRAADLLIGLDPLLYDPLPMGISVEFKQNDVERAQIASWHVWERVNRPGRRRGSPRALEGLETIVAFTPERLLDYVRFEREASGLGLDPPLRYRAAEIAAGDPPEPGQVHHALEDEFELTSLEILEIIATRARLNIAVPGGVAEHHLALRLRDDPQVASFRSLDEDAQPDFAVGLVDGRRLTIECKNASPRLYADGTVKVEVQKTRSQRGDPAGRLYRPDQFDVVAACLWAVSGLWEFRYKASVGLERHEVFADRIRPIQRVDGTWSHELAAALG